MSKINFWNLLQDNIVRIPDMQRDYVQGRIDAKTNRIRENFISDLLQALRPAQDPINLHFVYGSNIKKEGPYSLFIPIDGQQRLTTLFLLHWYLAIYSGQITQDIQNTLSRFQYETRYTAQEFCLYLATKTTKEPFTTQPDIPPSQIIKNFSWFLTSFEKDPTIQAMLVTLDEIHRQIRKRTLDNLADMWINLIKEDSPISFLFLDLQNTLHQTDSIYLKMNARGKPLTDFENFKSQLSQYLKSEEKQGQNFIALLNSRWSQFFWNPKYRIQVNSKDKVFSIDEPLLCFFRFCILMAYMTNLEVKGTDLEKAILNQNVSFNSKKRDFFNSVFETLWRTETDYQFSQHLFEDVKKDEKDDKYEYNEFQRIVCNSLQIISDNKPVTRDTFLTTIRKLLDILSYKDQNTNSSQTPLSFIQKDEWDKDYLREGEEKTFLRLIKNKTALSHTDMLMLLAEYAFLVKYADYDKDKDSYFFNTQTKGLALQEWLRLISNLIHFHHTSDENTWNYVLLKIQDIKRLLDASTKTDLGSLSIAAWRAHLTQCLASFSFHSFSEQQISEEIIKYQLMEQPLWKQAISEAEHTYLGGTISALLQFAGINKACFIWRSKIQLPQLPALTGKELLAPIAKNPYLQFVTYLRIFKLLFTNIHFKNQNEYLRRALLCKGQTKSYLLSTNSYFNFLTEATDSGMSFKRLLRADKSDQDACLCVKELLEDIATRQTKHTNQAASSAQPDTLPLQPILEDIITDTLANLPSDCQWKWPFLKYPQIIQQSGGKQIWKEGPDRILVLSRSKTNSSNWELYSYALYLELRQNNFAVFYEKSNGKMSQKYMKYKSSQQEIRVYYEIYSGTEPTFQGKYGFVAKTADQTGEYKQIKYESYSGTLTDKIEDMKKYIQATISR